jgi:hypothetical protein
LEGEERIKVDRKDMERFEKDKYREEREDRSNTKSKLNYIDNNRVE